MNPPTRILLGALGLGSIGVGGYLLFSESGSNALAAAGGLPPPPFPSLPSHPSNLIQATGYMNGQPAGLDLAPIGHGNHYLIPPAAEALLRMEAAANADDVTFSINSSFRTPKQQDSLVSKLGRYNEGGLAAKPGYSPHQAGIALDINVGSSGRGTPGTNTAWGWLVGGRNAARYGFVNDYLATNGSGEAWHFSWLPARAPSFAGSGLFAGC